MTSAENHTFMTLSENIYNCSYAVFYQIKIRDKNVEIICDVEALHIDEI